MTRVNLIDQASAPVASASTLTQIQAAFGLVPNMFKAVANSPAALASLWGSSGALGRGRIGTKLGEQIAVGGRRSQSLHLLPGRSHRARAEGRGDERRDG
jgi:hypothetical protein